MKYLFDTNVWISIFRGSDSVLREHWEQLEPGDVYLCAPVLAELYVGALKSQRREQNLALVEAVLLQHDCLHFGVREAYRLAELHQEMEKSGVAAATVDLQIAAIASAHGLTVVTRDLPDFRRIPRITLDDWQSSSAGGT